MGRAPSLVVVAVAALGLLGLATGARAQPAADAATVAPTPAVDAGVPAVGDAGGATAPTTVPIVDDASEAVPTVPADEGSDAGAPTSPPATDGGPPAPAPVPAGEDGFSPARALPDYDQRGDDPGTGWGWWLLRIPLAPLYLVTEFVFRRPLGFLIAGAEQAQLPALLVDFFTFGPEQKSGLIPTFLIDFGFLPSVGLYFFADDVGAEGHAIRIRGATWGEDWLTISLIDRVTIARETTLGIRAQGTRRKDWLFYGMGPNASRYNESRYSRDLLEAGLVLDSAFWRASTLRVFAGVRRSTFSSRETCCGEPSIDQRIVSGPGEWNDDRRMVVPDEDATREIMQQDIQNLVLPPGFTSGYFIYRQGFDVAVDSRRNRPDNASGFRVAASLEQAFSLEEPLQSRWVRWGGALGGFLDVSGLGHVVGLQVAAYFADPLGYDPRTGGDNEVPFTEQVMVGGNVLLRGFVEGYLIDRSALAATLEYRWPIWVFLDGTIQAAFGNVFGEHLDGLAIDRLRGSFTIGLRTLSRPDHAIDFMFGVGTQPIDDGFEVESIRFVIGGTTGF